ncbi:helix-turn-helix domain-containing protein [Streptomyces alkaliterrae]|uniref:Helix-turn-helix domain-containing protein n=1 Tax=Streptomyces alkaliterrae TaxID=2213162 RepID=A0A5P0YYY5_9ACTN|nr:helix-turn-helix transcriptional regulator [Streptomyces alkaliterrae]MBB1261624.1 helix-turn-helix domain-containing protein [Streptomyces alkaliterrae]MQS03689.1 helix-turn-helix domain-containing protein [Streptomyces alkaliterrae]
MSRRDQRRPEPAATAAGMFGEVLRHWRELCGMTQDQLARRIPCDRSLIARIEAGTRVPQDGFPAKCDKILKTGGLLARLWRRINWYEQVEHPDWFRRRAEMDAEAVALREYGTQVIPGLLQTEEYARVIFTVPDADDDTVEERVRARLSRQQRFLCPDGPLLMAVLDESALRTVIGGPAVMRDQCAHLLALGRQPNIRIQIAAANRPGLRRPDASMSLITLPDNEMWVYSESLDRGHFSSDPQLLARHWQTYDVLRADALSADDSAKLISDALEGYSHDGEAPGRRDALDQVQLQRKQRRQLHRVRPRYPRQRRPRT